jgi:glycosyltransferase involved in cell wall biosynthesis
MFYQNNILKISIITVSFNSVKTIERTIQSVLNQDYNNIEYIVVDGGSTDGTISILNKYNINYISESDEGIYDAMNKGIRKSTGNIIGILNSDDYYENDNVISKIVEVFNTGSQSLGIVYSDLIFKEDDKIKRLYKGKNFKNRDFLYGLMPPHPTVFIKKKHYDNNELYRTDFSISADFELLLRYMYIKKIESKYFPCITVVMSLGGISTKNWKNKIKLNEEIIKAFKYNNIKANYFKLFIKYIIRITEFILPSFRAYEK